MIIAIGFSSNFILSLGPEIAFYLFQLYRRVMLRGNECAAPSPGHSFVGGALPNTIGESPVFPCPCQTRADMRRMKPSLCYTHCCSQRLLYKLLVNLIRSTILHSTHGINAFLTSRNLYLWRSPRPIPRRRGAVAQEYVEARNIYDGEAMVV